MNSEDKKNLRMVEVTETNTNDMRSAKTPYQGRLDLGTDNYRNNPGPGHYSVISNTFAKPAITIRNKIPSHVHCETSNVSYIVPPKEKSVSFTIKSSGSNRKFYEETEGSAKFNVLPSTLRHSGITISNRPKSVIVNADIPGPGQYDPKEKSRKIGRSLENYSGRDTLWGDADNDVPGPGEYVTTKTYNKPSKWTEYLRYVKPRIPVTQLKRFRHSQEIIRT